jgi:hypothetical protein
LKKEEAMRWALLLCIPVVCAACTAGPLTLSPALEMELRTLVRTRCVPSAPGRPQTTTTPADRQSLQEVG